MTSWGVHVSEARELAAMEAVLREKIVVAWHCQHVYRRVVTAARSDADCAYWRTLEHHATDTLRDLLEIRKAGRMARRGT